MTKASGSSLPGGSARVVRTGGLLWLVAAVEFFLGMAVTQIGWDLLRSGSTPPYSLLANYISDLGAVHCGTLDSRMICSPWHVVFNVSIVLFGLLVLAGALLVREGFPGGRVRDLGIVLLLLGSVGAIGVGLSPEDVNRTVHTASALVAFVLGNLGVVVVGLAGLRQPGRHLREIYSILSGAVGLVAVVLFATGTYGPLQVGGMERLILAPVLLWAAVEGALLLRYAPPQPASPPATAAGR